MKHLDLEVEKLEDRIAQLRVGDGAKDQSDLGPLITRQHLEKVSNYVELGGSEGAELVVDGRKTVLPRGEGFFLGACLFDHVKPEMRIYREEIFGPVLGVVRVNNFETALQLINEHEFGNGTSLFTRDGDTARDFARRVQAGMVGINVPIPVPVAFHSLGGWNRALWGHQHMHGHEGVRCYHRR